MKISAGSMWNELSNSNRVIVALRHILIIPSWGGAFISPSVVFWSIAANWPSKVTIGITFAVLVVFTLLCCVDFARRLKESIFDVERAIFLSGLFFAFYVGVAVFAAKMGDDQNAFIAPLEPAIAS